jgi:hypothetical protein
LVFCLSRANAGSLTLGFEARDSVPGAFYGSAAVDTAGGIGDSGVLRLTVGNGQAGFLVLDDLDAGQPVGSFVATFDLRLGSDTSPVLHGDGLSFNFAPDIPDDVFILPEEGTGSGLRVSFDSFNNAGPAHEAPAIEVTFNNQIIATKLVNYLSTGTGFVHVKIEVHPGGTLDVFYGTNTVFTNLLCYAPAAGRFSFAANAAAERFIGDPVDMHWVDNLSIATKAVEGPFIQSASPRGDSVAPNPIIAIQLHDATTQVNASSVKLKLDSAEVTASVTKNGASTTVTYSPPGLLPAASSHLVELSYANNAASPKTYSVNYSFTVYPYPTLPASYAVNAASVDTTSSGFKIRTSQVSADAGTSVQRAELQLANKLTDPLDGSLLANIADLSAANSDGTFDVTDQIDFSASGTPAGFFNADVPFPGLVGMDQYALEILTFLKLDPGAYTFGVDMVRNYNTTAPGSFRESGFRLTASANPRDLFAPEMAVFDKNRPDGEKQFSFVVQQPGIYPFRLLWFSGVGASSLEWYQVTPQGDRILIGDTASGGIAAYREITVTHPYVQYTTTPAPGETSAPVNTPINLAVMDGSAKAQTNTIHLSLNNATVAATVAGDSANLGVTQVSFQPPGGLAPGSSNALHLVFTDTSGATYDQQWNFTVVNNNVAIPGLLAIEAEHFNTNTSIAVNGTSWEFATNKSGFSGTGTMVASPNVNLNVNVDTTISPRLDYNLNFDVAGTYYVWVRALGDSAPGSSQDDSVNVGIDGLLPASSSKITGFPPGGFVWSKTTVASTPATLVVSNAGSHTINVWMREDGFNFDKLLFTTNSAYAPTGFGPVESGGASEKPVLTYAAAANGVRLSWTGGGALQAATAVTGPYIPVPGGDINPIIVSIDVPQRYFRVARPE